MTQFPQRDTINFVKASENLKYTAFIRTTKGISLPISALNAKELVDTGSLEVMNLDSSVTTIVLAPNSVEYRLLNAMVYN